jgi:hypothetical protein
VIRQIHRAVYPRAVVAASLSPSRPSRESSGFRGLKIIALAAAIGCLNLSCGIQGPPLPPRIERPAQITDLSITQQGRAFVLRFTLPAVATDGERLTKPLEIQIFRTVTPPGAPAAAPEAAGAPAVTLGSVDLHKPSDGGKLEYSWKLSEQDYSGTLGETYAFAARGLTHGFRNRPLEGALSEIASAVLIDVSGPPENLKVHLTEKAVELDWSPAANTLSGKPLADFSGYRVYRSESGKPASFQSLAEVSSTTASDAGFTFDHAYYYKVPALFKKGTTEAVSDDSETVDITPHDVFPPAVPRDVTAIYTAGAVEIVWTPSAEPDLAGYNVFRRESGGTETRVNKEPVRTPVFRDQAAQAGHHYFYRVTTVDLTGNESGPSAEAEVDIR